MRAIWAIFPAFLMLAACGDPLAGVERVSDGAFVPQEDVSTALPTQEELARDTPILAGLFRRRDATQDVDVETVPSGDLAKTETPPTATEQGDIAADATDVADTDVTPIVPEQGRKGVLGWLRRAAVADETTTAQDDSLAGTDEGEDLDFDDGSNPQTDPVNDDVQIASLSPDVATADAQPDLVEPTKRRRLFGRSAPTSAPAAGMALRDVAMGTVLPFGEVGRVCDARPRDLGTLVEQAARKGPGYSLYDSAPDSEGPRAFYVTGFSDNCARQFTASLAIFGAPEFHEQLRYGLPAKEYPYSTTDQAYEKVKKQVCKVGRSKPCGPRISRLEKTTVFISVYEHFSENARWADMLLHDGALLAAAVKTP